MNVLHCCLFTGVSGASRIFALTLQMPVTSAHHQALRVLNGPLKVAAKSDDGIIEAIEHADASFIMAVQCRPEGNALQPERLIQGLIDHSANQ